MNSQTNDAGSPYGEPLKLAFVQQAAVLMAAVGLLDGGDLFRICAS